MKYFLKMIVCSLILGISAHSTLPGEKDIKLSDDYLAMVKHRMLYLSPDEIETLLSTGEFTLKGAKPEKIFLTRAYKGKKLITPKSFVSTDLNKISQATPHKMPLDFFPIYVFDKGILLEYLIRIPFYRPDESLAIWFIPQEQRYYRGSVPLSYELVQELERDHRRFYSYHQYDTTNDPGFPEEDVRKIVRGLDLSKSGVVELPPGSTQIADYKGRVWSVLRYKVKDNAEGNLPGIFSIINIQRKITNIRGGYIARISFLEGEKNIELYIRYTFNFNN